MSITAKVIRIKDGFVAQIGQPSALAAARVGWVHETRSSEVPNDELESL